MRFESIHIQGFGCLVEKNFQLLPGLNIFHGPNESGKSTLQQSIWALLYGYYSRDRKSPTESALLERYRPWKHDQYVAQLTYRLQTGSAFRILRIFDDDEPSTSVYDADTGRDITDRFERGRLGRLSFAREHFSLSQDVFINTCFVRQADLHNLADAAQEIGETIVNLSGTGSQSRSVSHALDILDRAFKEQVGSPQARTKPLPKAQSKLADLAIEAKAIGLRQSELEADYERRGGLLSKHDQLVNEISRLDLLASTMHRDDAANKINKALALQEEISRKHKLHAEIGAPIDFPIAMKETVNHLHQEWLSYFREFTAAKSDLESSRSGVANLERDRNNLHQTIGQLEISRETQVNRETEVRDLELHWRQATGLFTQMSQSLHLAEGAVRELEAIRAAGTPGTVRSDIQLQNLHDLGKQWEQFEQALHSAERKREGAQESLSTSNLTPESYAALAAKMSAINPTILADLKASESNARQLNEKHSSKRKSGYARFGLMAGLIGMAGIAGLIVGFTRNIGTLAIAGSGATVVSAIVLALLIGGWRSAARGHSTAVEAERALREQLSQYGFESVSEIEKTYVSSSAMRPAYDDLIESSRLVEQQSNKIAEVQNQVRNLLSLSPEAVITLETVETSEGCSRQIIEQLNELNRREQYRDRLVVDLNKSRKDLMTAEEQLRSSLRDLGLEGNDLSSGCSRYYDLCSKRPLLDVAEAQLATIDAKLEHIALVETKVRNAEIGMNTTETGLRRILRETGIGESDLGEAINVFQATCEKVESAHRISESAAGQSRELKALLGEQSVEQLKRQSADLSSRIDALIAADPTLAGMAVSGILTELPDQLRESQSRLSSCNIDLAAIRERIAGGLKGLRSLAEVEEEIEATQNEVANLALHGEALQLARTHLAEAADEHNRNFLPRLNQIVGQNLSQVTAGRYGSIQIDHADLQVRLEIPDQPRPITPEVLSRGAQEQIYLLLRLGLTELMSNGRERLPLILDDPLVNYDGDRLVRALDFLAELANHSQILLFTKDDEIVKWFASRHASSVNHQLHAMQALADIQSKSE